MAIVLEALRGDKPVVQICKEHGISDGMFYKWKDAALKAMEAALSDKRTQKSEGFEAERNRLLKIIGEQTCIIDLQKKISSMV